MEHGQIRQQGSLKEVLRAYKGPDAWPDEAHGAA
jgi:ABC-2 type transport system ATP-binding protein